MVDPDTSVVCQGVKETTSCNTRRVAEVWLDEYQVLYQTTLSSASAALDCGSTEKRKAKRKELKCKSFHWFLDNIYPELQVIKQSTRRLLSHCLTIQKSSPFSLFSSTQIPGDGDHAFGQIHYSQPGFLKCLDSVGEWF